MFVVHPLQFTKYGLQSIYFYIFLFYSVGIPTFWYSVIDLSQSLGIPRNQTRVRTRRSIAIRVFFSCTVLYRPTPDIVCSDVRYASFEPRIKRQWRSRGRKYDDTSENTSGGPVRTHY